MSPTKHRLLEALALSPAPIADKALRWCDHLGAMSDAPDMLYRPFGSAALEQAARAVESWMAEAGMDTRRDAFGSVIGRLPAADAHSPVLLCGSHLDTVPDGGRYDGSLGVLLPVALCAELPRRQLPFHIDVVAFLAEEGARFGTGCLSSRAFIGSLARADLEKRDRDGVRLAEAVRVHGGRPDEVGSPCLPATGVLGFLEVHIEQGAVLEARGLPVGVVDTIVGQSRGRVTFEGKADHAGTTSMEDRRDALVAGAEFVLEVERLARSQAGPHAHLVATVGRFDVAPNASNVVPGFVDLSLDVRHPVDEQRRAAVMHLIDFARARARDRQLRVGWRFDGERDTVTCAPALSAQLSRAVADVGCEVLRVPSLAGHDAMVLAAAVPVAMLFVRTPGGRSHHPEERVMPEDVATAARVLGHFVERLARDRYRSCASACVSAAPDLEARAAMPVILPP